MLVLNALNRVFLDKGSFSIRPHNSMKRILGLLMVGIIILPYGAFSQNNWKPLFNGENLDGWKKLNGTADYEIRGNEIVGITKTGTPNTFLATEEMYSDFILELEFWVDPIINSGVQIRSNSLPDYMDGRVHGYQVEMDPSPRGWTGGIYDEARRGWLYPLELNPQGRKAFKQGEWNKLRVEAIGYNIRTWLNGVPCVDLVDNLTAEGFIALQVHSIGSEHQAGKEVKWRNIRIQTENLLPSPYTNLFVVNKVPNSMTHQEKTLGWRLLFDGESTEHWRGAHKDHFPKKSWKVENEELIVMSSDGGESQAGGDIVTHETFSTFEFQVEFMLTEGANSGIKYFITEAYESGGSAIGLEYQILDDAKHPDAKKGTANNRTVASLYDLIPAHKGKPKVKPGEWHHARIVVSGLRETDWPNNREPGTSQFKGYHVEHWLDHRKVLEYERGNQAFDALVARSKYKDWEGFGKWQAGRILLQEHGDEVHYRSIKVRPLP